MSAQTIQFPPLPIVVWREGTRVADSMKYAPSLDGLKITPDVNEPIRKDSITTPEAVAHDFPNVQLVRVDPQFYTEDGSVRYSSGRSFFYADSDHLTEAGAETSAPDLHASTCRDQTERSVSLHARLILPLEDEIV